jgi:hypothetical protein
LRLFALLGALLVAGAVFLLVDAGIRVQRCMATDLFSLEVWTGKFWFLVPGKPELGLSQNAHWFLRVVGALIALPIGFKVIKVATR